MLAEYIIIEKSKQNFQKLLNQWKYNYIIEVIWINYDNIENLYRALILRRKIIEHIKTKSKSE